MKFIIAILFSIAISVFVLGALAVSGIVSIGKSGNNTGLTITLPIPRQDSKISDNFVTGTNTININTQAHLFLENLIIKDSEDIEELFTRFLVQEHNADKKIVNLMIQKCFWKNFYTLQAPLDSFNSLKSFETEYLMEKKLKTAGFIAMSLTLMEDELNKADIQFKVLQEKMSRGIKERIVL